MGKRKAGGGGVRGVSGATDRQAEGERAEW